MTGKNLGFTSGLCSLWELFLLVLFFHLFCFVFFFSVCHYLTNYCSNVECFSPECRKVIAHLASLLDWLKKLAPIFHPIRSKIKLTETRSRTFSRPFRQLHVINSSFYWFLVLSMYLGLPRVISLVLVLRHSIETALLFSLEESDEEPELACWMICPKRIVKINFLYISVSICDCYHSRLNLSFFSFLTPSGIKYSLIRFTRKSLAMPRRVVKY